MFTTGQLVFAALFVVVFVAIMVIVYRKDLALHKRYYKGTHWILLVFLAFIGLLYIIKVLTKDKIA